MSTRVRSDDPDVLDLTARTRPPSGQRAFIHDEPITRDYPILSEYRAAKEIDRVLEMAEVLGLTRRRSDTKLKV